MRARGTDESVPSASWVRPSRGRPRTASSFLFVAFSLLGCDIGGGAVGPDAPPPLSLVGVDVLAAANSDEPHWIGLADSEGALLDTTIELRFDRFLEPREVTRQAVCLRSELAPVSEALDCSGGVFLRPAYDPTRRVVQLRVSDDDLLEPDTLYALTVFVALDAGTGFRSFDGEPLEERAEFRFRTGSERRPEGFDPSPVRCEEAVGWLAARCGACHGATDAAAGLDLSSAEGLERTAIGQVAHGTQYGNAGPNPLVRPPRFGRQMSLIVPADPGQSYLLYKSLAASGEQSHDLLEGEIARLRTSLVVGDPMPPPTRAAVELGEDEGQLGWLSRWISEGACTR
jgi:hypothetical protein